MKEKNEIDVLIAGNKYTLCGYESSDYLQRIASYINGKYDEMRKATGNTLMDRERKNVFIQLNIADDYYKLKDKIENLLKEKEETDRLLFELKHDLVASKDKLEKQQKKNQELTVLIEAEKTRYKELEASVDELLEDNKG